jgi:hypothetical protein
MDRRAALENPPDAPVSGISGTIVGKDRILCGSLDLLHAG